MNNEMSTNKNEYDNKKDNKNIIEKITEIGKNQLKKNNEISINYEPLQTDTIIQDPNLNPITSKHMKWFFIIFNNLFRLAISFLYILMIVGTSLEITMKSFVGRILYLVGFISIFILMPCSILILTTVMCINRKKIGIYQVCDMLVTVYAVLILILLRETILFSVYCLHNGCNIK